MPYPQTGSTLATSHTDNTGDIIHAAEWNNHAFEINTIEAVHGPVVRSSISNFVNFKSHLGAPLERKKIPHAALLTKRAIEGKLDFPQNIANLPAATTSLATQLTGIAAGTRFRLAPGLYREALPSLTVANVTLEAQGDVAITAMDDWSAGTSNTWSAAGGANSGTSYVSSLSIPSFGTVDSDSPPITNATKAQPELVMVDRVQYNRVADGSTLSAGQFMLVNSSTDRRVVLCPPTHTMSGRLVEVTTRQTWFLPGAGGHDITLDGIAFYGAPSGYDQNGPIRQQSQANIILKNCWFSNTHGIVIQGGGAAGLRVLDCVFANVGSVCVVSGSQGTTLAGNVAYNLGGAQHTYSGALDESGYDYTWGAGFEKMVCDHSTVTNNAVFNCGFAAYWQDVLCKYGSITNNVSWDTRSVHIQIEVSQEFRCYGNHCFQTANTQFPAQAVGIYVSSSRDGIVGPDLSAGQEPNVVMRIGIQYKLGWNTTRTDLPPGGTNNAGSGLFKFVKCQHNIAIIRKTNGQGNGGPDTALQWSDLAGTGQSAISDPSNVGQHLIVGFENATENGASQMTWPTDFIIQSDVTGLSGQDPTNFFTTPQALNGNRWGNATDESGRNWPSRYATYAEQSEMLNWYGLPLLS